jgi:hypothetical protein
MEAGHSGTLSTVQERFASPRKGSACCAASGPRPQAFPGPVRVGDIETTFILDTGIGPNLISEALAARVGCSPDGSTFIGRRMSGQAVTVPLGSLTSLQLGTSLRRDIPVGIFDMHAMVGLEGVEGFLFLTYFGRRR